MPKAKAKATLYDIAHFCSWNGYAEDMRSYLGVDKASWTNKEFLFPYGANLTYGAKKKTRIQRICEEMLSSYDGKNYYHHCMMRSYDPMARIKELLADGAKPDIKDLEGWSALLVCCRNGWSDHLEVIKILLDAGADINQGTLQYGFTPLLLAANNGHMAIVRELLRRGANVNGGCTTGATPIQCAAENGYLEIVKELIAAGAIVNDAVLNKAIYYGQVAVLKYFLSLGHPLPQDAVLTAVNNNQANIIRTLAKAGANMNFGFPVHLAVRSDAHDCLLALCVGGSDLNLRDDANDLALTYAILKGNHKDIKALADYKANLNLMTDDMSPLHYAIMLYGIFTEEKEKRRECVLAMIDAAPDFKLVTLWGDTPAEDASRRQMPDIVTLIKRAELKQRMTNSQKKGKKL